MDNKPILTTVLPLDVLTWQWGSVTFVFGESLVEIEPVAWRIAFGVRYTQRRKLPIFFYGLNLDTHREVLQILSKTFWIYDEVYLFDNIDELLKHKNNNNAIFIVKDLENRYTIRLSHLAKATNSIVLWLTRSYIDIHNGREVLRQWRTIRHWGNKAIKVSVRFKEFEHEIFGINAYEYQMYLFIYPKLLKLPSWSWNPYSTEWYDWYKYGTYEKAVKRLLKELKSEGGELVKWLRQDL